MVNKNNNKAKHLFRFENEILPFNIWCVSLTFHNKYHDKYFNKNQPGKPKILMSVARDCAYIHIKPIYVYIV